MGETEVIERRGWLRGVNIRGILGVESRGNGHEEIFFQRGWVKKKIQRENYDKERDTYRYNRDWKTIRTHCEQLLGRMEHFQKCNKID